MLVAVIGGGAAGFAAAYSAASYGAEVTLFEKNEKLGKKIYISGKGRCNLTNDSDIENHIAHVISNPRFLFSAYHAFSPADLMALMESVGTPLKTERGGRVFPVSDKASDIIAAWKTLLGEAGVKIRLEEPVRQIEKTGEQFSIHTDHGIFVFDKVIIATGGFTYQATGSTGDGYRFAEKFGHGLTDLRPSLVGIKADVPACLAGLSLKNVELSVYSAGKVLFRDFGEMLFTHGGISGPIVLSASAKINRLDLSEVRLTIDLKPALTLEMLDARLIREFAAQANKSLKNAMPALMPKSLIEFVLGQAGISLLRPCHSVTKEERRALCSKIKAIEIMPTGFEEFNGAIVTAGGVSVSEINAKDMQSKIVPGLYFAGEVLDVDALTGGYNLQIAFSTGYLAGRSAAKA